MRVFVRRDLDGFFGLFIDNLVQLLLIIALCRGLCGMTGDDGRFIYRVILPGAAISILLGNLFFAWQAHRLARREQRDDVTALPYGINTPSLLVYVFFVMAPAYRKTGSAEVAWQMGLVACAGSGIIELLGSLVADAVRRRTPRAALLSTLAGIAIGFISMTFVLQIWSRPLIAMVPLAIVLLTYFSGVRFPLGLPGGLVAVACGTLLAWLLPTGWVGHATERAAVAEAWTRQGWSWPVWSGGALFTTITRNPGEWFGFLSVIIPMGLFNVIGSLQNIESAEAAGDAFDTRSALAANGVGTVAAALLGSCFPTTVYIGHPGWKGLGARAGYSTLNGLAITVLCFTGTLVVVSRIIPLEAGVAIVLWIGVVITAQAFQATPRAHAPAVAVGLFPAIAAWGATLVFGTFPLAGGATLQSVLQGNAGADVSGFGLHGLIVIERGYVFTCMILAAMCAHLIDRRFMSAALWSLIAAAVTAVGLAHAYQLSGNHVDFLLFFTQAPPATVSVPGPIYYRADNIAGAYVAMAVVFAGVAFYARRPRQTRLEDSAR